MIDAIEVGQTVYIDDSPLVILDNINLSIASGESVAIVGASGSGKSTLLGLLAGLDVPSHGKVLLNEHNITKMNEEQRAAIRAQNVAFIFQNFQLLPSYSALDNVALPLHLKGIEGAKQIAADYLAQVGLAHRQRHTPSQLSGGEQQRVAVARAFACQSPILFADEPTGNLDARTGHQIRDLLFELNTRNQTTLVLVTHDTSLANHCQRTVKIHDGRLES